MILLCSPRWDNEINGLEEGDLLINEVGQLDLSLLPHIKGVVGDSAYIKAFEAINKYDLPIPCYIDEKGKSWDDKAWHAFMNRVNDYEEAMRPSFLARLSSYCEGNKVPLGTPGHHKGTFFGAHPAGQSLLEVLGQEIFTLDVSSSDAPMGDPVIHDGPTSEAEALAAKVFGADKTYFLVNGTSGSNKSVCSALLRPGDVVLMDRNSHKSLYQGALTQIGAQPIFLETNRTAQGVIEGIPSHCFQLDYIESQLKELERAHKGASTFENKGKRPIRLAILQHITYDGLIYNVEKIINQIGSLCDYILFDAAWLGYEKALQLPVAYQPLGLDLGPESPGIFVTQSVHKQMAGLSQCSQLHKKDSHLEGQERYCPDYLVDYGVMLQASTSPFYPFIGVMEANAIMHDGPIRRFLWDRVKELVAKASEAIDEGCTYFSVYRYGGDDMMMQDPCKLTLLTKGINSDGTYEDFGIPAIIVSQYLIEKGIVPEKCGNHSLLFLFTPGDDETFVKALFKALSDFEEDLHKGVYVKDVLPSLYACHSEFYEDLTLKALCERMHGFYMSHGINQAEQALFKKESLPPIAMNGQEANYILVGGEGEWVYIEDALGRMALESAIAYPPGIVLVNGGEIWTEEAIQYFMALEALANEFPGFLVEVQGLRYKHEKGSLRLVTSVK